MHPQQSTRKISWLWLERIPIKMDHWSKSHLCLRPIRKRWRWHTTHTILPTLPHIKKICCTQKTLQIRTLRIMPPRKGIRSILHQRRHSYWRTIRRRYNQLQSKQEDWLGRHLEPSQKRSTTWNPLTNKTHSLLKAQISTERLWQDHSHSTSLKRHMDPRWIRSR